MSNNIKKRSEIQSFFNPKHNQVYTYNEIYNNTITVIEDGHTFEENALKKIAALPPLNDIKNQQNTIILADDSGLEVDALNNRPGIYSARYGGDTLTDIDRCNLLLNELSNVSNRKARFVCVIALQLPTGDTHTITGICTGTIAKTIAGHTGFGYDPIFIPNGYNQTFAQLGPKIKSKHSHRAKALKQVSTHCQQILTP